MTLYIVFFLFIGCLCFVFLGKKLMTSLQKEAEYGLYNVRDRLVLLVAEDILKEDGDVFSHYYERINFILNAAPSIGLDDILKNMFTNFETEEDLDQALEAAKTRLDSLLTSEEFKEKIVCDVVEEYYQSLNVAILAHSSILRTINFFAIRAVREVIDNVLSMYLSKYSQAKKIMLYTDYGRDNTHKVSLNAC